MIAAPASKFSQVESKMPKRKLRLPNSFNLAIYRLEQIAEETRRRNEERKVEALRKRNLLKRAVRKIQKAYRERFRGTISYKGQIQISQDIKSVRGTFPTNVPKNMIENAIENKIQEHYAGVDFTILWASFQITLRPRGVFQELVYVNNRMRDERPFSIVNLFSNSINIQSTDGNCVVDVLTKKFPKIAKLKKSPIPNLKNANTVEIMNFCKEYNIRAIAYNIHKDVIAENIPEKDDKKYATLAYLYYNNHMYLLENPYLYEKPEPIKTEQMGYEDMKQFFNSLIQERIIPASIQLQGDEITSFIHNNTIYFNNPDYNTVLEIGRRFMFSDKIPHHTSLSTIMTYIEKLYTSSYAISFLPIHHAKPAYFYNTKRDPTREIMTIDKNKAYSDILRKLPYLLSTDYRTYELTTTSVFDDEIALYIASPETPNLLLPKQDIYTGQHIKFCIKNNVPFKIHEKLVCKKNDNHFSFIVNDLYTKFPPDHPDTSHIAKTIICRTIGRFQSEPSADESDITLVNKDDVDPKKHQFKYNDELYFQFTKNNRTKNIYNRKPIAIQIKDRMNQEIFLKMKELNLGESDIVQIKTDSITFYTKPFQVVKTSKKMGEWKRGEYKEAQGSIYDTATPFTTFFQARENQNTIYQGDAGNGKSYHIQNHLDLTDAIILSSKHSAIRQHREKKLNAQVIQKYSGINEKTPTIIPKEHHIIVEEVGILTRQHWDFLFKCFLLGKKITVYGDFKQLLPYDEIYTFNRPAWLNMMFTNQYQLDANWRNDFTADYYASLYNSTDPEYLKQELLKYSTKTPEEADVIIAYRNTIVKQYNEYMLNYHNKKITDNGVPLICKTNDLKQYDIYNNFIMLREELPQEISDELIENPKVFLPAYARTLFNLQGDSIRSFYVVPEDMSWFLKPRMAYTLISRLKTK